MGYYPPYFPDNYLQTLKFFPGSSYKIKKIEPIEKKNIAEYRSPRNIHLNHFVQGLQGKGRHVDKCV